MDMIKPPAEMLFEAELRALREEDTGKRPPEWLLSPAYVRDFIIGRDQPAILDGKEVVITRKFYGNDVLIERAVVTLAGNRGLMLVGDPGTAKTMLSELLSAAISGTSLNTIQGTAGTTEDMIKYSWNYAMLLDKGPSEAALVPAPLYNGMKQGIMTRFEEITRCPAEAQDSLISILSDKVMNIPELDGGVLFAKPGFNVIATANIRDKGVNEMSGALKRRFNFETIKPVSSMKMEAKIIENGARSLLMHSGVDAEIDLFVVELLATTFMELRSGITREGYKIDIPAASMSTAEAVSVYVQSAMTSYYYENKSISLDRLVQNMLGTIAKENEKDLSILKTYFSKVVKERSKEDVIWKDYYEERKWIG
ncbi:AAA domain (dynein-related subfamily) [Paenibacillus algorifonticola]|uniref:AAA domain (Dynein-related subfamily) n=1 Tax=Paenibacillus algorifonticola TaxID=684063 RepID=A0A1I2FC41_9BACL|nr:AAA family ATPase [Paenibacillus algorifonticola]SFF02337.1 AAA domain (dynein-related subfamily) [Paenibacillus algorifonticola]